MEIIGYITVFCWAASCNSPPRDGRSNFPVFFASVWTPWILWNFWLDLPGDSLARYDVRRTGQALGGMSAPFHVGPRGGLFRGRSDQPPASSSSMNPEITSSPLFQNAGSDASSPNGASSSLCRFVPPARSISRYFAWKPGCPDWNTAYSAFTKQSPNAYA